MIENGDTGYFAPMTIVHRRTRRTRRRSFYRRDGLHWLNIDAVCWFAREVLPGVAQQRPDARFYIIGMNPTKTVSALATDSRVIVTGKVPDVRPYLNMRPQLSLRCGWRAGYRTKSSKRWPWRNLWSRRLRRRAE